MASISCGDSTALYLLLILVTFSPAIHSIKITFFCENLTQLVGIKSYEIYFFTSVIQSNSLIIINVRLFKFKNTSLHFILNYSEFLLL